MTAWIVCCMHFKDPTMDTKSKIRQLVTCVSAMALLYLLTGCITADPSSDYEQTASLADDRTGSPISLEEAWSNPFTERSDAWDGIEQIGRAHV